MHVSNIRLGLATNSSSTHYIIFLTDPNKYSNNYDGEQEFGWDHFLLVDKQSKLDYLSQILYHNLVQQVGVDIAKVVIEKWCDGTQVNTAGYIDHESFLGLPNKFNYLYEPVSINKEFFDALKEFMLQKDIAISGGNDNDPLPAIVDDEPSMHWFGSGLPSSPHLVCRKDLNNNTWFLFNRKNGTRFTLSFDGNENFLPSTPLLVDVKITDKCPYNCSFCYQDSKKDGEEADIKLVSKLFAVLGKLQVFEVAINGGDPTEHSEFQKILYKARQWGLVPNFSTKNEEFIIEHLKDKNEFDYGAVALSVVGDQDIKTFVQKLIKNDVFDEFKRSGVFHHVMGTSHLYQLTHVFETAKFYSIPLILLGYKEVGRGTKCKPYDYSKWVDSFIDVYGNGYNSVGIDTLLASQFSSELSDKGVAKSTYSLDESDSSLYIDLVGGFIGPSSYCEKSKLEKIDFENITEAELYDKIVELFGKFRSKSVEEKSLMYRRRVDF